MKLKIVLAGVIAGVLVMVSSTVFAAPIVNGGFEAGLGGWTASSSSPSGFVDVVATCPTSGPPACAGAFAPYQPAEGTRFALLWSRGAGTMSVRSNGVQVAAGALLTGRVFFADGELAGTTTACDTATVRVFLYSTPVTLFSTNSCATTGNDSTKWLMFQYQAPAAGILSVEATLVNTFGSQELVSAMGLDAVQVVEPVQAAPPPRVGAFPLGGNGTRDNLARQAAADAAAQQIAAAVVAAAQPATGALRPPSTGDGGLLNESSENSSGFMALAAVLGLTVMGASVLRLRLGATRR